MGLLSRPGLTPCGPWSLGVLGPLPWLLAAVRISGGFRKTQALAINSAAVVSLGAFISQEEVRCFAGNWHSQLIMNNDHSLGTPVPGTVLSGFPSISFNSQNIPAGWGAVLDRGGH